MPFNEVDRKIIPILLYSIIHKSTKCFKYLLMNGIGDPNNDILKDRQNRMFHNVNVNQYEWDCMAIAIYYGAIEIIKILEERGIRKGKNPGHIEAAILSYRNGIAKEIINNMRENNERLTNQIFNKHLLASVKSNNIKGLEIFFKNCSNVNLNLKDYNGRGPLHYAAMNNSKEMIQILISKGADINAKNNYKTPLHIAAQNHSMEIVEILITKGANINAQANIGTNFSKRI